MRNQIGYLVLCVYLVMIHGPTNFFYIASIFSRYIDHHVDMLLD